MPCEEAIMMHDQLELRPEGGDVLTGDNESLQEIL